VFELGIWIIRLPSDFPQLKIRAS